MPATVPEFTNSTSPPPPRAADGAVLPPVPRYSRFPVDSPANSGSNIGPALIQPPIQAPDSGYSSGREYPEVPEYVYPSSRERRRAPDNAYRTARDNREAQDSEYAPRRKHVAVPASDYAAYREYQEVSDSDYHPSQLYRERRKRREHRETSDSKYDYAAQQEYRELPDSDYSPARGHRVRREPRETPDYSDSDCVAHPGHLKRRGHRETSDSNSDYAAHQEHREVPDADNRPARRTRVRWEPRETPDYLDSDYAAHPGHRKRREHRGETSPAYNPRLYHKETSDRYYNSDYPALREHREAHDSVYRRPARGHRKRREQRQVPDCDYRPALPPTVASDPGPGASPTFNSRPSLPPTSNSLPAHAPTAGSVPAMLATAETVPAPAPPPNPSWASAVDEYDLKIAAPAADGLAAQNIAPLDTIPVDVSPVGVPPVDIVPSPAVPLAINTKQHMAAVSAPRPPSPHTAAAAAAAAVPRPPPPAGSPHDARLPIGLASPTLENIVEDKRSHKPPGRSTACSILLCIHSSSRIRGAKNYRIPVFRGHSNGESTSDKDLFLQLRRTYNTELRSSWQRFFSLRGLKYISVVEYTHPESPVLLPLDGASRNSMLYAFNKPHKMGKEGAWVDWVFALKERPPRRYGLEFVQGWDERKIVVLAAVPWVCSVITAVLWSVLAGDVQAAMAVASYILTASGVVLALLGILSTLEG